MNPPGANGMELKSASSAPGKNGSRGRISLIFPSAAAGGNDAAVLAQRVTGRGQPLEDAVEPGFKAVYAMVFENDVLDPVEQAIGNGGENVIFAAFAIDLEQIDGVEPMRFEEILESDAWQLALLRSLIPV